METRKKLKRVGMLYSTVDKYAPFGEKECEGRCERKPLITKKGPLVVCDSCLRVVLDNRK